MKKIYYFLWLCILQSALLAGEIDLRLYEKRLISQNGEDGVIQKIFQLIGASSRYYVEFGAGKGHYASNTKYLREKFGWRGLLLEGGQPDNPRINLHKAFITAENICELFKKYGVPEEFDLISIDIDRNDWYVWKSLSEKYWPRVVVIESQSVIPWNEDKVIQYDAKAIWNGFDHMGASILALYNLGRYLGYSLVYEEVAGVNLFFVRDDIIEELKKREICFKDMNDVQKLYTGQPEALNSGRLTWVSSQSLLGR